MDELFGALCAGLDPELWFPLDEDGPGGVEARGVCAVCPVKAACLRVALGEGRDVGIWGGLSARERRGVRAGPRAA